LAIGLAIASMAVASGCAADDDIQRSGAPSTGVTEQASRIQWCDVDYLDSEGHIIGSCLYPCEGGEICSGITDGPQAVRIETSCEPCRCHGGAPDCP
jgi:hypothetical protein